MVTTNHGYFTAYKMNRVANRRRRKHSFRYVSVRSDEDIQNEIKRTSHYSIRIISAKRVRWLLRWILYTGALTRNNYRTISECNWIRMNYQCTSKSLLLTRHERRQSCWKWSSANPQTLTESRSIIDVGNMLISFDTSNMPRIILCYYCVT